MRTLFLVLVFILSLVSPSNAGFSSGGSGGGSASISDTAYDATSWDNVTDIAPSKNVVRDKLETLAPGGLVRGIPFIIAGGVADTITATYSPAITLTNGIIVAFEALAANATTTPSFNPNGLGALTIVKKGGTALVVGDIPGEHAVCILEYNLAHTRWELLNPAFLQTTISGNAGTASALAADPANCSSGQAPLGIDASGAVEGCWTPQTNLSLLAGTMTNTYLCTYTTSGTVLSCNTNPATFMPYSLLTAAGDIIVGSGVGTATIIGKGANNSLLGVNGSGVLGYYTSISSDNTAAQFYDSVVPTKLVKVDPVGVTAGKTATIAFSNTDNAVHTMPPITSAVSYTIASGSNALDFASTATAACATVISVAATGVATTDVIHFTPNASIKAVTGYIPATTGGFTITAYPTANYVNFEACNWTAGAVDPGSITVNWMVIR